MPILHYCPLADIAVFICLFYSVSPPTSFSVVFPIVVVQSLSHVGLCNPWTAAHQAPLSFTISWNLLKFMSIESVMLSHHLILYSFFCPQSFPASGSFSVSQLFTSGGQSIEASTSASVLSINILGLVSFRINWFLFLTVQGTLKSLLQYNLKASILWRSAFFMVQLSHPYMTTAKTIALTILVTLMITTQSLSYAKNSTSFLNF